MNMRNLRSSLSAVAIGITMVVGAFDPMQRLFLVLPGSGLIAFGIVCGVAVRLTIGGCLYQLNWQTKAKPMTALA